MVETLVSAILVFGLLVFVHELGHFITAKLTGMQVDEFAVGFGPKLVSYKYGETVYTIRVVPLGGFNDIAGMTPEDNTVGERGYAAKPILSRMIVILAGAAMNLFLPVLLFWGVFFFHGVQQANPEPVLGRVIESRPAAEAGLREGDRIISVNGKAVADWSNLVEIIRQGKSDTPLNMQVYRASEQREFTTSVSPQYDASLNYSVIGIMNAVTVKEVGFTESVTLAVAGTKAVIVTMVEGLYRIILELSGEELSGPIGVAQMAGEVAQQGLIPLINFTAFLSINLGIVNLLPIPALDGGHFLTLCVEAVRGKPLGPKAMTYIQNAGIGIIILLMLLAVKNDIMRIIMGL